MKTINFDQTKFKVVKNNRGSERGELLDKFLEKLNPTREKSGYKKLTHPRLSVMLSHIPTDELYAFYSQCEKSNIPFSPFFFWSLKAQKDKK